MAAADERGVMRDASPAISSPSFAIGTGQAGSAGGSRAESDGAALGMSDPSEGQDESRYRNLLNDADDHLLSLDKRLGSKETASEGQDGIRSRRPWRRARMLVPVAVSLIPVAIITVSIVWLASAIAGMNPAISSVTGGGAGASGLSAGGTGATSASKRQIGADQPRVNVDGSVYEMFSSSEEEPERDADTLVEKSLELACSAIGTDYLTEADAAKVGCTLDGMGRLHVPEAGNGRHTNPTYRAEGIPQTENILAFWDEEKELGLGGIGWYGPASCSPWIGSMIRSLGYDDKIATAAGRDNWVSPWTGETTDNCISAHGEGCYMYYHPESFECIEGDANRPIREQCEPGDVLAARYHILVYVGNEAAQRYFPGTTGDVVEAGEFGRAYPGVTGSGAGNLGTYKIFRMRNKPASTSESLSTSGMTGRSASSRSGAFPRKAGRVSGALDKGAKASKKAQGILDSARQVGSPGSGLCAKWISLVWSNAGYAYPYGNACDMYWNWCKSSNKSSLKPGMIVAVPSHSHTDAGRIYGHVGIYMGNGMVRDNIGYIRDISLNEWIAYYGSSTTRWGWPNGEPLG